MENIVLYLLCGSLVISKCKHSKLSKKKTKMNLFYPTIGYCPSHSEAIAESMAQSYSAMSILYLCLYIYVFFICFCCKIIALAAKRSISNIEMCKPLLDVRLL